MPACVTSGPSPETAALRMRSNCTSQPTTSTSTFTPVLRSNGWTMLLHVVLRLGRVGHGPERQGPPFRASAGARRGFLVSCCSSPPQATRRRRQRERRRDQRRDRDDLWARCSSPSVEQKRFWRMRRALRGTRSSLSLLGRRRSAGGGSANDELDGERDQRGTSASPSICAQQRLARRRAQAGLVLAERGQRRVDVGGELDVVEADDRQVLGHVQAGVGRRADGADAPSCPRPRTAPSAARRARAARRVAAGRSRRRSRRRRRTRRGRRARAPAARAVAAQAIGARARVEQAGDRGDPAVPELVQVAHRERPRRPRCRTSRPRGGPGKLHVDAHASASRRARAGAPRDRRRRRRSGRMPSTLWWRQRLR